MPVSACHCQIISQEGRGKRRRRKYASYIYHKSANSQSIAARPLVLLRILLFNRSAHSAGPISDNGRNGGRHLRRESEQRNARQKRVWRFVISLRLQGPISEVKRSDHVSGGILVLDISVSRSIQHSSPYARLYLNMQ